MRFLTHTILAGVTALALHLPAAARLASQAPAPAPRAAVDSTVTLDDAVRRALAVHPSIEAATAAVAAARAGVGAARAASLPRVAADALTVRHQEPMVVAPIHGFDPSAPPDFDRTLVQGSLALDYTIFDGGRRGAGTREARSAAGASQADLADTRAALIERTAQAYLALLTARDQAAAHDALRSALEAERARVARFLEEGSAARLELLRADAELARANADGEAARRRLTLATATLALLLDEPTETVAGWSLDDPVAPETAARPVATPVDADARAAAAAPPPPVARALARLDAAEARLDLARATRLPTVGAVGGYALYAGGSTPATGEWRAGVRLTYPLFTGGQRGATIDRAAAETRAARAQVDAARQETALVAESARAAEAEARARTDALATAVASYDELTRVERLALDEGSGVQSDYLRAVAELARARSDLARARRAVIEARILEARATGLLTLDWIERSLEEQP